MASHPGTPFLLDVTPRLYTGERGDGGEYIYALDLSPDLCGKLEYRIRAYPFHKALSHRFELGLMKWI